MWEGKGGQAGFSYIPSCPPRLRSLCSFPRPAGCALPRTTSSQTSQDELHTRQTRGDNGSNGLLCRFPPEFLQLQPRRDWLASVLVSPSLSLPLCGVWSLPPMNGFPNKKKKNPWPPGPRIRTFSLALRCMEDRQDVDVGCRSPTTTDKTGILRKALVAYLPRSLLQCLRSEYLRHRNHRGGQECECEEATSEGGRRES